MDLTEGGIRVPWIAHWPAVIRPGSTSTQTCMTMDWSATMLDAAGARRRQPPAGWPLAHALLRDATWRDDQPLFWRMNHRGQRAMRHGPWKYLRVDGTTTSSTWKATNANAPTWPPSPPSAGGHGAGVGGVGSHHAAHPGRCHGEPGLWGQRHAAALSH